MAADLDGRLVGFNVGARLVMLRGLRGDQYAIRVRRQIERLRGCVWDGEIDDTEY